MNVENRSCKSSKSIFAGATNEVEKRHNMHCNKDIQTYRLHIIMVILILEDETVVKRIELF